MYLQLVMEYRTIISIQIEILHLTQTVNKLRKKNKRQGRLLLLICIQLTSNTNKRDLMIHSVLLHFLFRFRKKKKHPVLRSRSFS